MIDYTPREFLIALAIKYEGDWSKVFQGMRLKEEMEDEYILEVRKMKCKVLTQLDADFPVYLKRIYKSPLVLFYYGDINLLFDYQNNVSIVGSRDYSEYGETVTKEIAGGLAQHGFTIVSGMARGIDAIAHQSCIDNGGKTIAVLGSGIDYCYPPENFDLYKEIKKNHLIISEYPGRTVPQTYYFPIRNRIIAHISKTLVLTEAKICSGSSITAHLALAGNADVMCVPHQAGTDSLCNQLINVGAALVENSKDVLENMNKF